MNTRDKALEFRNLHQGPGCLLMPNPWDAGSAKILNAAGFKALGTTSAGFAFSRGLQDGQVLPAEAMLANIQEIVAATRLPVSGDLENGWGHSPRSVAKSIKIAAEMGLAGASIEDVGESQVYEIDLAVDRIRAAVEAVSGLPRPFVLTARADGMLHGGDLSNSVRRLQAFQDAGAEVLYAPGLENLEQVASVLAEIDHPLNVLMGSPGFSANVGQLEQLGVSRISLGSSLARAAIGETVRAAAEFANDGTFGFGSRAKSYRSLSKLFGDA